jgi:hypothetical protein
VLFAIDKISPDHTVALKLDYNTVKTCYTTLIFEISQFVATKEPLTKCECCYKAFHGFGQDKFAYGGLVLGSSQFHNCPSCLKK